MSHEPVVNGVPSDSDVDIPVKDEDSDSTTNSNIQKLMQKITILEQEKQELIDDKESATEKIKALEREIERSESDKKALDSIASRAAELETDVSRLQHDLISSMTEGQDANAEASELKRLVEELKKSESEKAGKVDVIEKERNLLLERLNKETEKVKEGENRIRELEKKIEGFEARESGQKSDRANVEEEVKVKLNEKDDQIRSLKRMVDEFQSAIAKNRADMERLNKEKEGLEIGRNDLEALLKKSERKIKEMEQKIDQLRKELEAYEKINEVLKEKMVDDMNGVGATASRGVVLNDEEKRLMGLKLDWPVVAVTAGAVATIAIVYFRHARI